MKAASTKFWRRRTFQLALVGMFNVDAGVRANTTLPVTDLSTQIQIALSGEGQIDALALSLSKASVQNPETLQDLVQVELEQGRLKAALGHLKQLVTLDPANVERLEQLSDIEDLLGDTAAATQTLQTALQIGGDRTSLRLKLAVLLLDQGAAQQGIVQLDQCVATDPAAAQRAGILADLFGQSAASANYLRGVVPGDVPLKMLEGNASLEAGDTIHARQAFEWSLEHSTDASDRKYLYERLIATSRQDKTLSDLANKWLSQTDRATDQLYPLATVLRELGRSDELLTLWRDSAANPKYSAVALSSGFVSEVLSAAITAGQSEKVAAVCRQMIARNPDSADWMTTTVHVLLKADKPEDADALLLNLIQNFRQSPADLQRLGQLALSLGRYEVVKTAAKALIDLGNGNAISGQLLQADAYQRSGDHSSAQALLRETATAAVNSSTAFSDVASALDGAGLFPEEITFLRGYLAKHNNSDAAEWLATLLAQHDRESEAMSLLDHLRNSADSPALRAQASRRMLTIAGKENQLQPLIDRLKLQADSPVATEEDLSLLIDADVMANQSDAAAQVIKKTQLYNPIEKLHRLYILYLRTGRLELADATLHELLLAEPNNSLETLEQITTVALQRKRLPDAVEAMQQIKQRVAGTGDASLEFLGEFYDRVGYPADAATYYRRAIALHPDNAENWLLWAGECNKAGARESAGERLQLLCIQAKDDNTFTVASDGLLNLNMPPAVLRTARRQAVLRLATSPRSMILYHAICDLCEELHDTAFANRAIEMSLPQSRDERPQQLRELMESASRAGDVQAAVAAGRSLIAIGDEFPPGLFLDLGEQLLRVGRLQEADRALDRAVEVSGSDATIISRVADLYQKYGFADRALNTLKPLADRFKDDSAFCRQLAKLHDIVGRHDLAFDECLTALDLEIDAAERSGPDKEGTPVFAPGFTVHVSSLGKPPIAPAKVLHVLTQTTSQARTSQQQTRLINLLAHRLDSSRSNPSGDAMPKPMDWLSAMLRQTCFALNQPDVADQTDSNLLKQWPRDPILKQACVSQRMDWGLYDRAARFATGSGLPLPATLLCLQELQKPFQPTSEPTTITVEYAAKTLPALVAKGELDEARLIIKSLPGELSSSQVNALPVLTAAAFAVGDSDALLRWTLNRIDLTVASIRMPVPPPPSHVPPVSNTASPGPGGVIITSVSPQSNSLYPKSYLFQKAVSATWPMLLPAEQSAVLEHLVDIALHHRNPAVRNDAAILALKLSSSDPSALLSPLALVWQIDTGAVADVAKQCQLFALLGNTDRPAFIRQSLQRLPANLRLEFVLRVVAQTCEPIDTASQQMLVDAATAVSTPQLIDWRPWFCNLAQLKMLPALARLVVKDSEAGLLGDNPALLVAAAIAQGTTGDTTAADQTAATALRKLVAWQGEPAPYPSTLKKIDLIRFAVAMLSPQARSALLIEFKPLSQAVAERAVLLQADDHRVQALTLLRSGFAQNPDDSDVAWLYLQTLIEQNRLEEVVDAFGRRLLAGKFSQDDSKFRQKVAGVFEQLHRIPEATKILEQDDTQTVNSQSDLPWDLSIHDTQKLSQYIRSRLQKWDRPPEPFPPTLSDQWSACPESYDDLLAVLRTAAATGVAANDLRVVPWTQMLVRNAKSAGQIDNLLTMLSKAQADASLNKIDRFILRSLAVTPGITLPQPLKDELWRSAFDGESSAACELFASALEPQADPRAPAMKLWVSSLAQTTDSNSTIAPTDSPMTQLTDAVVVPRLTALMDAGRLDEADKQLGEDRLTGRITPQEIGLGLLWARIAAERGNMDLFSKRFEQTLCSWTWNLPRDGSNVPDPIVFELQQTMPKPGSNATLREQIGHAMIQQVKDENAIGSLQGVKDRVVISVTHWMTDHIP